METNEIMMVRILRGMMALDNHFGGREEWVHKINSSTLELSEYSMCVVGQTFDCQETYREYEENISTEVQYTNALKVMGLDTSQQAQIDHGFLSSDNSGTERMNYDSQQLTQGWMRILGWAPWKDSHSCTYCGATADDDHTFTLYDDTKIYFCSEYCVKAKTSDFFAASYTPQDSKKGVSWVSA